MYIHLKLETKFTRLIFDLIGYRSMFPILPIASPA
uniref:Uncharacterized protein n=1 Tax=Anguilla anguilla TaxID=7936 RepID=A0A0E9UZ25_ANGAN